MINVSPTLVIILVLAAFASLQTWRLDSCQDEARGNYTAHVEAVNRANTLAHERELALQSDMNTAAKQALKELQDVEARHEAAIAGLRSDNLQLRKRFACKTPEPTHPGSTSGTTAEAQGGLSGEDVEFLLREAKRADEVTIERNELVDIVAALRKRLNER